MRYGQYTALMAFFKVSNIINNLNTTNTNNTKREDWHKKLTPLDTYLQERFQAAVISSLRLLYNKIMIR
jgi:ATP adenylyltransferase/5',5'''-P-1,P-4-tetraphosphate phosphorylase II